MRACRMLHAVFAQILNKSVGWVSIWGMVYTYLPGVLVCYWQLLARRPSVRLPAWFKAWMDARKQLGLLSLFTSEWAALQLSINAASKTSATLWSDLDNAAGSVVT